jgi:diadenylate cyclase
MFQSVISNLLFIRIGIIDVVDILLVAFLMFLIYRLIRKTVAMNIFIGILAIYIIWKVVTLFQMELLSKILGQFISVGVIALLIVFQQELRKFLLLLGTPKFMPDPIARFFRSRGNVLEEATGNIEIVATAAEKMAVTHTGALIILVRDNKLPDMVNTGTLINARLSEGMLRTLFFKNSPLHDGAVIIDGSNIRAAGCILPVSGNKEIPAHFGLRHRAGIGITEQSDAIAVIISEETGQISYVIRGKIRHNVRPSDLKRVLPKELVK